MQLKKIVAAGSLAALMAGSSVAFAALQDLPAPFVATGSPSFLVVVGATAATDDVVGAIDVATRFGGESTRELTVGATSGGATVTGEGKSMETTNTKLYLNNNLKKTGLRHTMTSQDLPNLLKTDILKDTDANDEYKYDQYIEFSDDYVVNYSQYTDASSVATDPELVVKRTAGAANPSNPHNDDYFYKTRVVFQKDVNGSTAANEKLRIFGQDYVISTSTVTNSGTATNNKLILFGSSDTRVLTEKDGVTVTVGGKTYDVTLNGVSDADTVVLTIGSETKSIDKGVTSTIGGLQVYIEDVFFYGSTRTDNQAKIGLGALQLNFQHGSKVTVGSGTTTNLDGTFVNLSTSGTKLNTMEIYVVPSRSSMDAIKKGGEFVDPVFGSFKTKFSGASPDLMDASRDKIDIRPSGDNDVQMSFTDDKGNAATINWAHNESTTNVIGLEDAANYAIKVRENEPLYLNEYAVLDAGDFTHFVRWTSNNNDGTSTGNIEMTDVISGTKYKITTGTSGDATWYLDGQAYYVNGTGGTGTNSTISVTWGDGATLATNGTEITTWPVLKTRKGAYLALPKPKERVNLSVGAAAQTIWLPSGKANFLLWNDAGVNTVRINITAVSGWVVSGAPTTAAGAGNNNITYHSVTKSVPFQLGKTASGGLYYTFDVVGNFTYELTLRNGDGTSNMTQPAVVLREEDDKDGAQWHVVTAASSEVSGSTWQLIVGAPSFTNGVTSNTAQGGVSMKTDTYKTRYVDLFGTFAERNTNGQDTVVLYYPDEQMRNELFVIEKDATVTTTAASGGTTVKEAVPIKTSIAKLDTEVTNSDKTGKNLILVGGPAVNTLVAELASDGKTWDVETYRTKGAGTALVELVEDAFTSGKSALVVAGHSAADTRVATGVVQNFDGNTDKLKGVRAILEGGSWTSETV